VLTKVLNQLRYSLLVVTRLEQSLTLVQEFDEEALNLIDFIVEHTLEKRVENLTAMLSIFILEVVNHVEVELFNDGLDLFLLVVLFDILVLLGLHVAYEHLKVLLDLLVHYVIA